MILWVFLFDDFYLPITLKTLLTVYHVPCIILNTGDISIHKINELKKLLFSYRPGIILGGGET